MTPKCKHPIVKVVAREDDIEFVECQTCGEVFDSAEFSDIAIEEAETGNQTETED
jgi:Zn ribbon nucleic-acid-binding protein